jgi:hypothetical protein
VSIDDSVPKVVKNTDTAARGTKLSDVNRRRVWISPPWLLKLTVAGQLLG